MGEFGFGAHEHAGIFEQLRRGGVTSSRAAQHRQVSSRDGRNGTAQRALAPQHVKAIGAFDQRDRSRLGVPRRLRLNDSFLREGRRDERGMAQMGPKTQEGLQTPGENVTGLTNAGHHTEGEERA